MLVRLALLASACAFAPRNPLSIAPHTSLRRYIRTASIEDAPDAEGQTISHWDENAGSTRWALVEPSLAALKKEQRELGEASARLEQKIAAIRALQFSLAEEIARDPEAFFARADVDTSGDLTFDEWAQACATAVGDVDASIVRRLFDEMDYNKDGVVSLAEFTQLRNQLVACQLKAEALGKTIDQYRPDEHAPECIAAGGQGMILVGKDLATGERVAIKVEKVAEDGAAESDLEREFDVLRELQDDPMFPSVLHFGRQQLNSNPKPTDCRVMVMDLLGASISDLWFETTRGSRGFDAPTTIALAVRMLDLLERVHAGGYIHRDIKPANFVMSGDGGRGRGQLRLIDFGIAVPIEEEKAKAAKTGSSLWGKQFFGTRVYASATAHDGDAQSFRDDLEAVVYVLAFLTNGGVPWGAAERSLDEVGAMKRLAVASIIAGDCEQGGSRHGEQICDLVRCDDRAVAVAIRELLAHCRELNFGDLPDYAHCKAVLMKAYSAVTGRSELAEEQEWNDPPKPRQSARSATAGVDLMDLI